MSSKDIFHGFLTAPPLTIANTAFQAVFVRSPDALFVLFWHREALAGVVQKEGVVHVASRVRLRLKERVKVPEATLDPLVRWHLVETHG